MEPADPEVAAYIAQWRPSSLSPQAAAFARDVIGQVAPEGRERAKNLLWAAGKLADYAIPLGLEPVPEVVLHPSTAERFTRRAPGLSGVARRTLRTNLRFIGRRVVPQLYPAGYAAAPGTCQGPLQPGGDRRVSRLGGRPAHPAAADAGGGAGLPGRRRRADPRRPARRARHRRACRSGGVIVTVRGARPRAVPVLARYHDRLLAAAAFAGTGLICGGTDPGRRNITTPLIRSLAGGAGLPRLDTSRLRATWLADAAQLLGLATFMHAAGITCSQRLGDLLAGLEPAAEADAVRLLGAARPS